MPRSRPQIQVQARLELWLADQLARRLPGAGRARCGAARSARRRPPCARWRAAWSTRAASSPRADVAAAVDALDPAGAQAAAARIGVTIGALDLFDAAACSSPVRRAGARAVARRARGRPVEAGPPDGATVLDRGSPGATLADGFRPLGAQAVRVDLVERIARAAHEARAGRKPFAPDPALATSIGMSGETLARLMAALGFRTAPAAEGAAALGMARHRPRQSRLRRCATTLLPRSLPWGLRVAEGEVRAAMRLDRFLWFARLAKTRSAAQALAADRQLPRRWPPRRTRPCPGPRRIDARLCPGQPGARDQGREAAATARPRARSAGLLQRSHD